MPILDITEEENKDFPKQKPIKEVMNIQIPNIIDGIPNRNGFIWLITGAGGSGKTSMLLNFFKSKDLYRCKFDHIFYFCPETSFNSVEKHPFVNHDKVFFDLTIESLINVYDQLVTIKEESIKEGIPEYSCLIIDDFADQAKKKDIEAMMKKILIKTRHLQCAVIWTLQSYLLFPKQLRKCISNVTIFKPKNLEEWESICKEMFVMNKKDNLTIYKYIFNTPYAHLDIDLPTGTYYKNFNKLKFTDSDPVVNAILE